MVYGFDPQYVSVFFVTAKSTLVGAAREKLWGSGGIASMRQESRLFLCAQTHARTHTQYRSKFRAKTQQQQPSVDLRKDME